MTDKEQIIIDGVDVICENCGKQFKKKLYEYKRNKHHFCSPDCYHRICDRLTNMQNRGVNKNSSTGYNGIYFNKKGKFVAHCQINKTRKYLGAYDTLEKALEALNKYKEDNKIE